MRRMLAAMAVGAVLTMWAHGDFGNMRPVGGRTTLPAGARRETRKDASETHSDRSG